LTDKRRRALAILLLLQAPLFGWHALATLIANPDVKVTPVAQLAIAVLADSLATALVIILGVFVWRGSSIAVGASVVGGAIEILLAGSTLTWFALFYGTGGLLLVLLVLQPLVALGALAIPTLILGVSIRAAENSEASSAPR
jgi:hypothetical protein